MFLHDTLLNDDSQRTVTVLLLLSVNVAQTETAEHVTFY